MESFPDLLRRLNEGGVRYVIVGGIAAITHGSLRHTYDLDICAPLDHDNVVRIIRALAGTHPRWRMCPDLPEISPDNPMLRGLRNLYLVTDLGPLDVLGELPGVGTVEDAERRSEEAHFHGIKCRVIDLDALIAAKSFANRPKDQPALRELEAIRELRRKRRCGQDRLRAKATSLGASPRGDLRRRSAASNPAGT